MENVIVGLVLRVEDAIVMGRCERLGFAEQQRLCLRHQINPARMIRPPKTAKLNNYTLILSALGSTVGAFADCVAVDELKAATETGVNTNIVRMIIYQV